MEYELVKCYDTITKSYVTVEVTKEVSQFLKRSYWREDMQERRYNMRKVALDEAVGYSSAYISQVQELVDIVLKIETEVEVRNAISKLEDRDRLIVYYVYYERKNLSETARIIGISSSHMSRLVKRLQGKLRVMLANRV